MALSILNNIPSLVAENQVNITHNNLQSTLFQLASGSRINSGADDAAGLAIANGLQANVSALTQSVQNANDGIGSLQVADGAYGQVSNLLNRAITLATESANGVVSDSQRTAINAEYTAIKQEIDNIGTNTTFNGTSVFTGTATSIFLSDGNANTTIATTVSTLSSAGLSLSTDLTSASNATTALGQIDAAIATVASNRGTVGAAINQLQAATSVINNQVQNLTSAVDGITAADIPSVVANLTKYSILNQTGIASLAQANSQEQQVLALLR